MARVFYTVGFLSFNYSSICALLKAFHSLLSAPRLPVSQMGPYRQVVGL